MKHTANEIAFISQKALQRLSEVHKGELLDPNIRSWTICSESSLTKNPANSEKCSLMWKLNWKMTSLCTEHVLVGSQISWFYLEIHSSEAATIEVWLYHQVITCGKGFSTRCVLLELHCAVITLKLRGACVTLLNLPFTLSVYFFFAEHERIVRVRLASRKRSAVNWSPRTSQGACFCCSSRHQPCES